MCIWINLFYFYVCIFHRFQSNSVYLHKAFLLFTVQFNWNPYRCTSNILLKLDCIVHKIWCFSSKCLFLCYAYQWHHIQFTCVKFREILKKSSWKYTKFYSCIWCLMYMRGLTDAMYPWMGFTLHLLTRHQHKFAPILSNNPYCVQSIVYNIT